MEEVNSGYGWSVYRDLETPELSSGWLDMTETKLPGQAGKCRFGNLIFRCMRSLKKKFMEIVYCGEKKYQGFGILRVCAKINLSINHELSEVPLNYNFWTWISERDSTQSKKQEAQDWKWPSFGAGIIQVGLNSSRAIETLALVLLFPASVPL